MEECNLCELYKTFTSIRNMGIMTEEEAFHIIFRQVESDMIDELIALEDEMSVLSDTEDFHEISYEAGYDDGQKETAMELFEMFKSYMEMISNDDVTED